jgi:hypothetical protein
MRSGAKVLKYIAEFKEFDLEELIQDSLPEYFSINDIEQILKIDCQSLLTDEIRNDIEFPEYQP